MIRPISVATEGYLGSDGRVPLEMASQGYLLIEVEIDPGYGVPPEKKSLIAQQLDYDKTKDRREQLLLIEDEEILLIVKTFMLCD